MILRAGRDADADAIIALISACWAEYPGVFMDVDGENPELRSLASHFAKAGGALWVAEQDGTLTGTLSGTLSGMVATRPSKSGTWELCRMYLAADARGSGLADELIRTATDHARAAGATHLHLWSDTRFDRAHRFYERHGFVREGGIKPLLDASNTLDFGYAKPLAGVVVARLDTAAASSAARSLGRILQACVQSGASVSFLPPFPLADAEAFYRRRATEVATAHRILLAAWVDGALAGTVTVDLATPPNQPHRAEIQKLLVHPDHRRHGVARALMQAAETAAAAAGRTLLTLDTHTGGSGERLYVSAGWIESGRIPDYAVNADGSHGGATFFYKQLGRAVSHV